MSLWKLDSGGRLTMFNCGAWLAVLLLLKSELLPDEVFIAPTILLALPFAWFVLLHHLPTTFGVVSASIAIGLNSLAWGYGLAAIQRWWRRPDGTKGDGPDRSF